MVWLIAIGILVVRWFFLPSRQHIEAYEVRRVRVTALQNAFDKHEIAFKHLVGILAHHRIFPVALTLYLLFLVIQQTNVFGLAWTDRYFLFNETILLIITIIT